MSKNNTSYSKEDRLLVQDVDKLSKSSIDKNGQPDVQEVYTLDRNEVEEEDKLRFQDKGVSLQESYTEIGGFGKSLDF